MSRSQAMRSPLLPTKVSTQAGERPMLRAPSHERFKSIPHRSAHSYALSLGVVVFGLLAVTASSAMAAVSGAAVEPLYLFGVPVDFILFGATLLGVALFHHNTLQVALVGLVAI